MTENPGHMDLEDLKARIKNLAGAIRCENNLIKKTALFEKGKDELMDLIRRWPSPVNKRYPKTTTPCGVEMWLHDNSFGKLGFDDCQNPIKKSKTSPKKKKTFKVHTACPTDMARTPIFYPMSKQEMKEWPYFHRHLIDTAWGQTYFSGPKLCIWDEMVFLSIMHLFCDNNSHVFRKIDIVIREEIDGVTVEHEPQNTYLFDGCASDLLRPIYDRKSNFSASDFSQLSESLTRFQTSTFVHHPNSELDGLNYKCYNIIHGLSSKKSRRGNDVGIKFSIDPFVIQRQKFLTHLDLSVFTSIRGKYADFGRAIYRFISSHRDKKWVGHFEKICSAILVNPEMSAKEKRKRINGAIERLVEVKVLRPGQSKLMKNGQLHLVAK